MPIRGRIGVWGHMEKAQKCFKEQGIFCMNKGSGMQKKQFALIFQGNISRKDAEMPIKYI